jgi:hypothetical protein
MSGLVCATKVRISRLGALFETRVISYEVSLFENVSRCLGVDALVEKADDSQKADDFMDVKCVQEGQCILTMWGV